MSYKHLVFRYLLVFVFVCVFTLLAFESYKDRLINTHLSNSIHAFQNSSKHRLDEKKKSIELIYFNNLLYDEKIKEIYNEIAQQKKNSKQKERLFEHLKERFYYFRSYGIQSINFYLPNNELLLNMRHDKHRQLPFNHEALLYVNNNHKEMHTFISHTNGLSFIVLKPFFSENLEYLGAIEIEIALETLLQDIEKTAEFEVMYLDSTEHFKSNEYYEVTKTFGASFTPFKKEQYFQQIFEQFRAEELQNIEKKMKTKKEFGVKLFYNNQYQAALFIPLFHQLTQEHLGYIMALGNSNISEVSKKETLFNCIAIVGFFIILILFIMIYTLHILVYKKNTLLKKHNDLLKAIDKYVVMAQTDTSGFMTYVTQAFCDTSGYTKKELIGRNINIIRHPDMSKKFFENMWKELLANKQWEGEIKNIDKNGNSCWVKGIIFTQYDIKNRIIGYSSIRVNITDTKQLKKINALLKEDLSNKLHEIKMRDESLTHSTKTILMGKILDSLAHQWKKPVSNISIALANLKARLLANDLESNKVQSIHNEIEFQLKTLSLSLNEFKSFFNNTDQNDQYNLYFAVEESFALVKPECDLHKIELSLNAQKEIPCYGVYNEIKQIMINLLKHSIEQIIANSTINPSIEILIEVSSEDVIIKMHDNVKGNSKYLIERVFSNQYDEQTYKDLGINLYIVKLLLEKIGAKFWFENKNDEIVLCIKLVTIDRRKDLRS